MTCTSSTNPCVGLTMNPDLERRKELERRKKLRLLQVRQQSKEFADRLRERVKEEIIQQKKIYAESEKKLKQEKHLQELRNLKELYDRCLQSIGKGHKEAAEQPNVSEEKQAELARISTKASVRGAKATKKQVEEEVSLKKKIEAPVKQKKVTRNKENLRAFFISSLPKHVKNHKRHHSVSPPKSTHQNSVPLNTRRVLDEIPSNLRDYESRVSVLQNRISPEKPKSSGKEHCRKQTLPELTEPTNKQEQDSVLSNVSSAGECSCDYIVCSCHATPRKLRRCSSESRISNEKGSDFEEPRKKKLRSRSCSPTSVRTLNYFDCGNVYESNQKSFVRVTHHSRSPGETEEERKPNTEQEVSVSKPSIEDLKKRTEERCAKALRKEQLKRDFQQLIQNLKQLTREKSVINNKTKGKLRVFSSERDILTRNENKQRKLNDAFEKLSHCVKSTKTQNTQNTGVEKLHLIPVDDSSPPTLNLALYQANMPSRSHSPTLTRRVVSMEQITLESTAPTTISSGSKSVPKRTRSSGPKSTRSLSAAPGETVQVLSKPGVLVQTTEKGDVKIEVRVSEVTGRKQKSKSPSRSKSSTSHTSDSSYVSPPSNLTPSQQQLLDALLRQVNKNAIGAEMKNYIKKLLKMSRESIDQLRSSSSCQKICPSETESPGTDIERDLIKLGELAEVYAEKVNKLVDMHEQMSNSASSGGYVDVTRAPKSTPSSRGPTPSARSTPSPRPRSVRTPDVCPSPGQHTRTTPSPTSSGPPSPTSTADTDELLFGGFGGPPPPSDSQLAAVVAQHPELFGGLSPSEIEDYDDLVADFDERRKQILSRCESRTSCSPGSGADMGQTDMGFCDEGIRLDTISYTSASQGPVGSIQRLNNIKQNLANICNDQFCEIIEMLQKDANKDQHQFQNVLKEATSNPCTDSNASLAPSSPVDPFYVSSEWTVQ